MPELRRICVYAGANLGSNSAYRAGTERLAEVMAERGIGLVYGGGSVGLMGVLADAMLAAGGETIGVIPEMLVEREGHQRLADLRVVGSMHERKALMAQLVDGFVAVPGGFGTVEELIEVTTWTQLGLHDKPSGLLDIEGYYTPLTAFLDHAVEQGLLRHEHRGLLASSSEPEQLLDLLAAWERPPLGRTLEGEEQT